MKGGVKQLNKMLSRFLLVTAIVFLSVSVHAVSLVSNGEVHTITQGNLEFKTDGSGLVKLYKNGNYLASFGFTLKGTVNAQQKFLNSWSTSWTWQVLSNTDSNITVLGSTTWQGLDWKQRWFFSDTEQKFVNYLTNNTGFDITNTSFYYVVRFDPANVSCLQYVDNAGIGKQYCFGEDKTITQNLGQYLNRIKFMDTMFNFQDLIDSGFEFNYLFAGQLGNVKPSLSGQGFIVGVTKNGGLFPSGASIELDPTIIDASDLKKDNYGNTIVRDSNDNIFIVHEETVSPSNTDIFVSKSTDDGETWTTFNLTNSSDFNELLPHIDINSTDGLLIEYDKIFNPLINVQIFVTTCSAGGCDEASDFLTDFNVSGCGAGTNCRNGDVTFDQNDFAHIIYSKAAATIQYRRNTSYVGALGNWGAEEQVLNAGGGEFLGREGTGVIVAKNGSDNKLVFAQTNSEELEIGYFNGTVWASFILGTGAVSQPASGFAGYDGNFYLVYTKNAGASSKTIHFTQCIVTSDCSSSGNFSTDLNITNRGLDMSLVSMFQSSDLNIHVLASPLVDAIDVNIQHFVRLPNNVWTTSDIGDGNLLVSDANRTYNPLLANKDYVGSFTDGTSFPVSVTKLLYTYFTSNNSTGDPSTLVFDSNVITDINGIIASFTVSPSTNLALDPENGITNVTADFNSTSKELGILDVNYLWQRDSVEISTDQNISMDFNGSNNDFNISLIVNGNDGTTHFTSQSDQNILLRQSAQGIDINFSFNAEATLADVNFGVTADGNTDTINFAVWGFPNDNNLLGLVVNQQYRVGDSKQVCVVVNTTGDINKLRCEDFFITRIITKIPKNITNLSLITPFDASIDSTPPQSFTNSSEDGNFWFFYQGLDSNSHNLIVDANVSFFLSTYFIGLNGVDLNQTIQPYMVPATEGINVIITAKDSLTNDTVKGVIAAFNRTVSTDGDVLVVAGTTDDLGRISLPFIAGIDHNFTLQFPFGTIIRTGTYIPQTIDATNGIAISVASTSLFDVNAIGVTDINYLQSQVTPQSPIDLNTIITSTRTIAAVTITVDHNGVQLATDSNSNCPTTCQFNFTIEVGGLDETFPLIETVDINYADGGTFQSTKAITISRQPFDLFNSFTTAKTEDLGDIGGTMFLSAVIIAILLGIVHFSFPSVDNSPTFVLAATILLFLSFVGWVDGVTWVVATIGAGAVYFMRRVDK